MSALFWLLSVLVLSQGESLRCVGSPGVTLRPSFPSAHPLSLFPFLGALSDIQLIQSGSEMVPPGQSLSLTCAITGESVSDGAYFHWIRQPPGKGLEWMGSIDKISSGWRTYYASFLQGRITISADTSTNSISLQLSSLTAADAATYYCARGTVRRPKRSAMQESFPGL